MDARRNRAWILDSDAIYLYDVQTRRLVKRIELPGWLLVDEAYSCAPDLTIGPSGAAFVTSNITPDIWEIDPQDITVRRHALVLDADADKDVGLTGLAFDRESGTLFGVSAMLGTLWNIDLRRDTAYKVRLSRPVRGGCGLVALNVQRPSKPAPPILCIAGSKPADGVELNSDMREGRTTSGACEP
ncbi:MAG TPA: hypothetical protein VFP44_23415 [Usitatibacter sp.]|nr:hypothetical protein [Usitatibacter sp.]